MVSVKCIGIFFKPLKCLLVGKIKFVKNKRIYLKIFGQFKGVICFSDISEEIFVVNEEKKSLINVEDDTIIQKNMLI